MFFLDCRCTVNVLASYHTLITSCLSSVIVCLLLIVGPSVTITVDTSPTNTNYGSGWSTPEACKRSAKVIADKLMAYAVETREFSSATDYTIPQAVAYAKAHCKKRHPELYRNDAQGTAGDSIVGVGIVKPLVIADVSDNPGSGHYGDATLLLNELINQQVSGVIFYAIFDAEAVLEGQAIGVGKVGTITLGGKTMLNHYHKTGEHYDPNSAVGGPPLRLTGKVVSLTDGSFPTYGPMGFGGAWQNFGLSMLFRVGHPSVESNKEINYNSNNAVDIVVISNNGQLLDIAQITSLGCDYRHKDVIVVKSKHHFRASLEQEAEEVITVNGGGLGSFLINSSNAESERDSDDNKPSGHDEIARFFKNVRRPIWPLDPIEECYGH